MICRVCRLCQFDVTGTRGRAADDPRDIVALADIIASEATTDLAEATADDDVSVGLNSGSEDKASRFGISAPVMGR